MKISANKFVAVTYDLYVGEGEERELMEKATREVPLKFIYGTGSMIQAFEDALMGLESGSRFRLYDYSGKRLWRIQRRLCIGFAEEYL